MMELHTLIFILVVSYNAMTTTASKAVSAVSDGNAQFSNSLYKILSRNEGNVFFSPLSAHAVLSLAYQGAAGDTATSFENALHLTGTKKSAKGYKDLMQQLNSVQDVKLHIANKVFVQRQSKLKERFNTIVKNYYLAEVENVDFTQNAATAKHINEWVEQKTNNKITDLISADTLDISTKLVLVNAIYFKGDWLRQFDVAKTTKEKFYLSEEDTVNCDMMHINRKFRYGEDIDLDVQILSLPYKNENFSLIVILPKSKTGIKELEAKLQTTSLNSLTRNMFTSDIILSLPKFKIETTIELKEPLSELGLGNIFSDHADFSNMLESPENLKVSKVVQKAFIEVNEEGAEASAATSFELVPFAIPLEQPKFVFAANRPFIFALSYRNEENLFPLFVGKVTKL